MIIDDRACSAGAQPHCVEQREPVRSDHRRPEQLRQSERYHARGNQREHVQLAEHRRSRAQSRVEDRRRRRVRDRGRQKGVQNGVQQRGQEGSAGKRSRMDAVISVPPRRSISEMTRIRTHTKLYYFTTIKVTRKLYSKRNFPRD